MSAFVLKKSTFSNRWTDHMGPEGVQNRKKTPIFYVDAK